MSPLLHCRGGLLHHRSRSANDRHTCIDINYFIGHNGRRHHSIGRDPPATAQPQWWYTQLLSLTWVGYWKQFWKPYPACTFLSQYQQSGEGDHTGDRPELLPWTDCPAGWHTPGRPVACPLVLIPLGNLHPRGLIRIHTGIGLTRVTQQCNRQVTTFRRIHWIILRRWREQI